MRKLSFFALAGIFLALLQVLPVHASAALQLSGEHPNYVVIGAFRVHKNAIRLTSSASKDLSVKARYEWNANRSLYYVYVLNTANREEAIAEAIRLREQSSFADTWVYSGMFKKMEGDASGTYAGVDIHPVTERSIDNVTTSDNVPAGESVPPVVAQGAGSSTLPENTAVAEIKEPDNGVNGKKFFFRLYRGTDQKPVDGEVDVIHQAKLKKIGSYKGNMDVRIAEPPGTSANLSMVCEVFGYRKLQRDIDYNAPAGDGVEVSETGTTVIPFELVRLQKGDIAIMYNVYFYKDAAIMRPESRYEVTSLLEMLKENEKYRIRIHGHANGKSNGRIISAAEGSTNYFSLNNTKDGFGSAKKLSEERAEVIRKFLLTSGIAAGRMELKAWGGKRPIHDKHSTRAQENVRVEIEILDN